MSELSKDQDRERSRENPSGQTLTNNQGLRVSDDQQTPRAGARGPELLEDFILREKITHFDHEQIPERVVHARGAGAYGYFPVYAPLPELTMAKFLQEPGGREPRSSCASRPLLARAGRSVRGRAGADHRGLPL